MTLVHLQTLSTTVEAFLSKKQAQLLFLSRSRTYLFMI